MIICLGFWLIVIENTRGSYCSDYNQGKALCVPLWVLINKKIILPCFSWRIWLYNPVCLSFCRIWPGLLFWASAYCSCVSIRKKPVNDMREVRIVVTVWQILSAVGWWITLPDKCWDNPGINKIAPIVGIILSPHTTVLGIIYPVWQKI